MEERIYKFVNKKYQVSYMVTKEELDVLNTSYNKEEYMEDRHYRLNNISSFSELETEEYTADEKIKDNSQDPERKVIIKMIIQEMFDLLSEEEKKVVIRTLIQGCHATEVASEIHKNSKAVLRTKQRAIEKMKRYLSKIGVNSYNDAIGMIEK